MKRYVGAVSLGFGPSGTRILLERRSAFV